MQLADVPPNTRIRVLPTPKEVSHLLVKAGAALVEATGRVEVLEAEIVRLSRDLRQVRREYKFYRGAVFSRLGNR